MLIKLYFILLTTAVGMVMGPDGAQAAKDVESDKQTLHEQLLKGRFPHVTKPFYNDASHSYDIVPTLSGYQFRNSYNLPTRVRSKGVHLSATSGSLGPFVEQVRLTDLDSEVTRISDDLGYSLSVDGNTAVVGASGDENNRGSAYVFTYDGGAWIETAKLIPTDGEANEFFGHSVAMDGNTIVVSSIYVAYVFTYDSGTWTETDRLTPDLNLEANFWTGLASVSVSDSTIAVSTFGGEDDRGSVYVFTYDGEMWVETVELVAFDGENYDLFGYSVSVDGRTIVVGAQGDDRRRGSVYVFTYDGGMWAETVKLVASDGEAYDLFGQSVSISDSTIVVGAPRDGDNGRLSGAVYVFTYDGRMWTEMVKLTPTDGEAFDYFGHSVSVDGRTIAVGTDRDADSGRYSGSAYVFTYDGGMWAETAKFIASDGEADDDFGYSVSMDGRTIVVGAHGDDDNGRSSGAVYVFTYDGETWTETVKLTPADSEGRDRFGRSVSISGNTIVAGAQGDDRRRGAVYVFTYDGGTWAETAKLTASDGEVYDFFGHSVSVDGRTIVTGTDRDAGVVRFSGSAYVFTYDGEMWTETAKLVVSDGEAHDLFGHSVSVSGRTIVIGALGDADNGGFSGSAYVFTQDGEMWTETAKLTAADGIANDYFGEAVSVDRGVVVVGAAGGDNRRGSAYVYRVPLVERADADGDGVIGMPDFRVFAEAYRTTDLRFDFNEDGTVGFSDFLIFISLYSESA